jgi:hypothetical protein
MTNNEKTKKINGLRGDYPSRFTMRNSIAPPRFRAMTKWKEIAILVLGEKRAALKYHSHLLGD